MSWYTSGCPQKMRFCWLAIMLRRHQKVLRAMQHLWLDLEPGTECADAERLIARMFASATLDCDLAIALEKFGLSAFDA